MIEDKTKGRILVFAQFGLAFIVLAASVIEKSLTARNIPDALYIISLILMFSGIAVVITALISFGQKITPNPVPLQTAELRTRGIYSLIRHPMYFSVLLFVTGFTLYEGAYYSFILNIVVFIFLAVKIKFEEKQLVKKFPEYKAYQYKTKKILPFIY
jgi:protein-S-isoprenylcysteine O-methyltransferase Ste14